MSRKLSDFHRNAIIVLKNSGKSWQEIQLELSIKYQKVVTKRGMQYVWKKYLETGSIVDKNRKGRPTAVSPRGQRTIKRMCTANRYLPVSSIAVTYNSYTSENVSHSTVQRILKRYGLRSYKAVKKPFLNLSQRRKRVTWANTFSTWNIKKWGAVVFSDECVIQSLPSTRTLRVRRTSAERNKPALFQPVMRHGPKIHVWGCFSSNGVGILKRISGTMNAEQYQRNILKDINIIGECLVFPEQKFVFQHDLAPPHRAQGTQDILQMKNVDVLPWPGNSPDLNPIENLWSILKSKVKGMNYNSSDDLWKLFYNEWYQISPKVCRSLIASMPKRLELVKKCKGHPTKY